MKYLVLLTPAAGRQPAEFQALMTAEEQAVWSGYSNGWIRELYFQPDPVTVVFVVEAEDIADVDSHLGVLPMVEAGLLERQVVAMGPWLQFEQLFEPAFRLNKGA